MGRKSKYERCVKPYLDDITKWTEEYNEGEIAAMLKIAPETFSRYKTLFPELAEAVNNGKNNLVKELKNTLKKKARGFHYEETKITKIHNPDDEADQEWIEKIEVNQKYAQPDTGAIHLLLKNLDPDWRNDDEATMKLKKEQLEIQKKRAEADSW